MADIAHLPQSYSLDEYLNLDITPSKQIIDSGLLIVGGRMVLGAAEKSGKTVLLTQTALELASGDPWMGLIDIPEPKRVQIFQKELGDDIFRDRLEKATRSYARVKSDNLNIVQHDVMQGINFDTPTGVALFFSLLEDYRPDVAMVDSLSVFHSFDEDRSFLMKKVADVLDKAIIRYHVSIILSHHFKKPSVDFRTGKAIRQDRKDFRGSGFWLQWADTLVWMNDLGSGKRLMEYVARHGEEEPQNFVLTLDRKKVIFKGEIQNSPTTAVEYSTIQILSKEPNHECLYDDLLGKLQKGHVAAQTAKHAISTLRSQNNLYFVGLNGSRIVRLLSPSARAWVT